MRLAVVLLISLLAAPPGCGTASTRPWTRDESRLSELLAGPRVTHHDEVRRAPTRPEHVKVYAHRRDPWIPDAEEGSPPDAARRIARIEVGRTEPDDEGAVAQLRALAASLGADALGDVGCQMVLGPSYRISGTPLVPRHTRVIRGWVFYADALVLERTDERR